MARPDRNSVRVIAKNGFRYTKKRVETNCSRKEIAQTPLDEDGGEGRIGIGSEDVRR